MPQQQKAWQETEMLERTCLPLSLKQQYKNYEAAPRLTQNDFWHEFGSTVVENI